MTKERKKTHIDIHREQFIRSGKLSSLLPLSMISDEDMTPIVDDFKQKLFLYKKNMKEEEASDELYYKIYAEVLGGWGIMCPHPEKFRRYGAVGDRNSSKDDSEYYNCSMCNCLVLNQEWIKNNAKREEKREETGGNPEQGRIRGT